MKRKATVDGTDLTEVVNNNSINDYINNIIDEKLRSSVRSTVTLLYSFAHVSHSGRAAHVGRRRSSTSPSSAQRPTSNHVGRSSATQRWRTRLSCLPFLIRAIIIMKLFTKRQFIFFITRLSNCQFQLHETIYKTAINFN